MPPALPKLSYVLLSHNREKYIRAAIESAFAQDYEGELEYIFSDDCSTDRTFEIIKECVAAYKGNRRVVVTQTPRNLHLAGNTNHAVQFVESDWIVRADDDDYSSIHRCSLIGEAIARQPDAKYIVLRMTTFSEEEADKQYEAAMTYTPEDVSYRTVNAAKGDIERFQGGLYSYKVWHSDVYRRFQKLDLNAYYADDLIAFFRAVAIGCGVYVESQPLVYALSGDTNMCRGGISAQSYYDKCIKHEHFIHRYYNLTYKPLLNTLHEIEEYLKSRDQSDYTDFLNYLRNDVETRRLMKDYWSNGMLYRISVMRKLHTCNTFTLIRTLPLHLFAFIYFVIKTIKGQKKND